MAAHKTNTKAESDADVASAKFVQELSRDGVFKDMYVWWFPLASRLWLPRVGWEGIHQEALKFSPTPPACRKQRGQQRARTRAQKGHRDRPGNQEGSTRRRPSGPRRSAERPQAALAGEPPRELDHLHVKGSLGGKLPSRPNLPHFARARDPPEEAQGG